MMSRPALWSHPLARPFGMLCLIWLLLYLPVLLGVRVLPWDAIDEFYPTVWFNAHTLRLGLAPWWNPFVYSGYPQIADPQGMMFSPLLMGWMLLRANPGATWFDWGVLLHLLLGGMAIFALLRSKGANAFGSLLGATVFMGGGVAAARLEHTPAILAYAYAPLVMLSLRHFLAAPGWRRGALAGLAAGALVTQLVQVAYLLALMLAGYATVAIARRWPTCDAGERRRLGAGLLLAATCALALGLPQLLFSASYVALSNRATLPLATATAGSLDSRALLGFFDPNAWHALRGHYDGPASRVEAFLYLGALPTLLLAGLGTAYRDPRQRRQILFFLAVAIVAWFYMLGVNTPFYGWLYAWLPGVPQFRRPSDAAFLLNLAGAMLVGLAASGFDLRSRRQVGAVLALAACWLALSSLAMRDGNGHWQVASLFAALFAVLAAWRLQKPGSRRRTAVWLLLVLVADYRCFNLNGAFSQGHDKARSFLQRPTAAWLERQLAANTHGLSPRVEILDAGIAWDNHVALRGIGSTQGYNPLRYGLYDHWYGARENSNLPRPRTAFNQSPDSKLADLLGVAYLVKAHAAAGGWAPPAGYSRVLAGQTTDVWRNGHVYPRLLVPTRARLLAPGERITPRAFEQTDFADTVLLTPRDSNDRRSANADAATCTSRLSIVQAHADPAALTIRTRGSQPGWLALSELDFPGWVADVDGAPLPIHRANGMFRAVCVPAGAHTVRFSFHPWRMAMQVWSQPGWR